MTDLAHRTGGQIVVESLLAHGVTTSFGVPGESYLHVLDALHDVSDQLRFVICRQEGGACFMAEAWGKLTGQPGICFVTRGPGATNASIGVHTAMQDSTPMVLFVGQVGTHHQGREAFQEIDYEQFYGGVAKWVVEVADVDQLSTTVAEAFMTAASGRPGPVVVALPEDVLSATTDKAPTVPLQIPEPAPSDAELAAMIEQIEASSKPILLVGGGGWSDQARIDLARFAGANNLPVVVAFRFQDLMDNTAESYVGEAGVARPAAVRETITSADLIVAIGVRFGEMTTDAWSLLDPPSPGVAIVHVHADPTQLGRIYDTALSVEARPSPTIAALADSTVQPDPDRTSWRDARRAAFVDTLQRPPTPGAIDMVAVMEWLRANLPANVILTNGAGNFSLWPNKFFVFGPEARLLAPQSGAMGYGLPASIAAKAADPTRTVVCFAGDGDLQMTVQELGTAAQAGLQPIVLVLDNSMYGTIRMHQERHFPGRVVGTDIVNPDFVALARSYGFHAETVESTDDFPAAFERAMASDSGALLHLPIEFSMPS